MAIAAPLDTSRYDPRPDDDRRLETAIARRNTAWAAFQAAKARLDEVRRNDPPGIVLQAHVLDYNACLNEYEHARNDLMREQARWRSNRRWAA